MDNPVQTKCSTGKIEPQPTELRSSSMRNYRCFNPPHCGGLLCNAPKGAGKELAILLRSQ
jgi:hypothetical protein